MYDISEHLYYQIDNVYTVVTVYTFVNKRIEEGTHCKQGFV